MRLLRLTGKEYCLEDHSEESRLLYMVLPIPLYSLTSSIHTSLRLIYLTCRPKPEQSPYLLSTHTSLSYYLSPTYRPPVPWLPFSFSWVCLCSSRTSTLFYLGWGVILSPAFLPKALRIILKKQLSQERSYLTLPLSLLLLVGYFYFF